MIDGPTDALLRAAWSALGGEGGALDQVRTTGEPAVRLPSSLPVLPAMVAAVGAATLAAAVLDGARSGRAVPPVDLDVGHVALAARSERHARRAGQRAEDLFAPLSRFWATADGWLRLHANYAWHRERALRVLGGPDGPDAVAAAVRTWRGADLEDALAAAGAIGNAVRTRSEWAAHPQGAAVAARPLLTWTARSAPARPPGPGRAAEGVRVLDLTRVIAGPVATRMLAAWGAQVLRVDSPRLPEMAAQAVDTLPGKASATLDLADTDRLEELLAAADVVVQGYRPGALARFGLDAGALAVRHPHLTVVTLSAWGATGPWAGRRGFDSLVQCATGIADDEGSPERPGVLPAQVLDHATGYLAAAAVLLSLAGTARGAPARSVELSLASTAHWLTTPSPLSAPGATPPSPPSAPGAEEGRYLVTLPGAVDPVQVVAPPGRVGDLVPAWHRTTELGADPVAFPPARGGPAAC
ncbi:MAG: hypothetical protein JWR70_71 [Modestobacter sp.]|nr:hypothetical protein [Modestobacter sp.]